MNTYLWIYDSNVTNKKNPYDKGFFQHINIHDINYRPPGKGTLLYEHSPVHIADKVLVNIVPAVGKSCVYGL